MTPKEKAFHLYFFFMRDIIGDKEKAKQCAIKVCDEMLLLRYLLKKERYFYIEVKKEIEKL